MSQSPFQTRRRNTTPSAGGRGGFTLAELLIVIAIIAVLISILLPTLGAARRSANSSKCLASMRDLGLAFQQYAMENRRAFPVVEWSPPTAWVSDGIPQRSWQFFLVKYLHKRNLDGNTKLVDFQNGSPLWGCPEFSKDTWWADGVFPSGSASFDYTTPNAFNTGYGMHRWGLAPYGAAGGPPQDNGTWTPFKQGNIAIARNTAVNGSFLKMEQWSKRGAERGLLADSNNFDIIASALWSKAAAVGTGASEKKCPPFWTVPNPATGSNYVTVDGKRHLAPSTNIKKAFSMKGVNMLFADGHAAPVSPEEAWIAIRGGGVDIRQ